MEPLEYRLEDQFIAAGHQTVLRELHERGDINGLLEYALLLAVMDGTSRSKIAWLAKEALAAVPYHVGPLSVPATD